MPCQATPIALIFRSAKTESCERAAGVLQLLPSWRPPLSLEGARGLPEVAGEGPWPELRPASPGWVQCVDVGHTITHTLVALDGPSDDEMWLAAGWRRSGRWVRGGRAADQACPAEAAPAGILACMIACGDMSYIIAPVLRALSAHSAHSMAVQLPCSHPAPC